MGRGLGRTQAVGPLDARFMQAPARHRTWAAVVTAELVLAGNLELVDEFVVSAAAPAGVAERAARRGQFGVGDLADEFGPHPADTADLGGEGFGVQRWGVPPQRCEFGG